MEREGERGRETSKCERHIDQVPFTCPQPGTWPTTQASALTGNHTGDPLVHRPALNALSNNGQGICFYYSYCY